MSLEPAPSPVVNLASSPVQKNTPALAGFIVTLLPPVFTFLFPIIASFFPPAPIILLSLSVVSFLTAIIGVVLGHIGLQRAKQFAPANAYRGLAIAALVIGYVEVAIGLLIFGLIVLWVSLYIRMK